MSADGAIESIFGTRKKRAEAVSLCERRIRADPKVRYEIALWFSYAVHTRRNKHQLSPRESIASFTWIASDQTHPTLALVALPHCRPHYLQHGGG
jgi:hypothetical protein